MKSILFLVLIAFSQVLLAQNNFAPLGAYWNYGYNSQCANGPVSLKITKDSVVNGFGTKTITRYEILQVCNPLINGFTFDTIISNAGTLQVRKDSVFFGNHYSSPVTESYLYSFNMKVGDSLNTARDAKAVVVSMDSVNINGVLLKRWNINQYCFNLTPSSYNPQFITIIENIGPINDYLLWNIDKCYIGVDAPYHTFSCYNGGVISYNTPCYTVLGYLPKEQATATIKLLPNPANTGNVAIYTNSYNAKLISIKNTLGQIVVREHSTNDKVIVNLLQSGIYFVTVEEKGNYQTQKLIITD
jgi:hypothetical protein